MNIGELTRLERDALSCIFSSVFGQDKSEILLERLVVTGRTFSCGRHVTDPHSQEFCVGGYTDFSKIHLGDLYTGKLKHDYFAYARHAQLESVIGFVLFTTDDKTSFKFLELYFCGEQLPINLLTAESHGFYDFVGGED
ncbi:MAG: hypothetical protein PHP00_10340 [Thiotrichaceae bacterium]|nr:hypothetical protein [Thiotrichaceae bacterium]